LAEAAAVSQEIGLRQLLPAHNQDVPIEPRPIQRLPFATGHSLDVDAGHKRADLRSCVLDFQCADCFHRRCGLLVDADSKIRISLR
jgi:hypothetical protein